MTTPDFDTLEAQIRAEGDRRIAAAKTLAAARQTLLDAREEFARQDAANVSAFEKALAAAREAGFTDKALIDYKLADPTDTGHGRRTAASKTRAPRKASTRRSRRATAPEPAAGSAQPAANSGSKDADSVHSIAG